MLAKAKAATGLALLHSKKYKQVGAAVQLEQYNQNPALSPLCPCTLRYILSSAEAAAFSPPSFPHPLPPSPSPLLSSPSLPFCHSHHAPSPLHTQAARKLVDVNAELLLGAGFIPPLPPRQAARKLVEVNAELLGAGYSDVVSPQDVAMFGGLCALATFDRCVWGGTRVTAHLGKSSPPCPFSLSSPPPPPPPNRSELQKQVMSNIAFREFMELTPEVRGGGRCR